MNNYVLVKVTGKNVNNYLKWLINSKIDIIKLAIIKYSEMNILINYQDLDKLTKYSKTYKITIIKKYGQIRLLDIVKNNYINILSLILSVALLYFLSHIIFSVDILYNDRDVIKTIEKELTKYDIRRFTFKKNYAYLSKVKEKILSDNKDTIEWLEIEESGTKYIVRIVERKKATKIEEYKYQSIVASRDATILSINASSGEKVKEVNEYVKKGDTIISGVLTKSDNTLLYVRAKGKVIAETWYKASIEYPLYYQEEKVTGKTKKVLALYFLNRELPLFPYKKYKQLRKTSNIIFESNIIPIKIAKEKLYEVNIKEDIYTEEEALEKAIRLTKKILLSQNDKIIEINNIIVLNKENLNSKIKADLFISTTEDITNIVEVIPEQLDES